MKFLFAVLLLVVLTGCASTGRESNSSAPQITYGGTMETTVTSSYGI